MVPCHFETNSDQMLSKSLPGLSLDKAAQMMRGYANVLRDRVESKVWVGVRTFQIRECHSNPKAHSRDRRLAHQRLNHIRCLHAMYPGRDAETLERLPGWRLTRMGNSAPRLFYRAAHQQPSTAHTVDNFPQP